MITKKINNLKLIFIFMIITSSITSASKPLPLTGKIITIDPGHGGRDPGTTYNELQEKNINLEIALKLEKELLNKGATVYLIRRSDTDLSSIYDKSKKRGDLYRRIKIIKENKSDLYISVHINWYKNSYYSGAEVLYNAINPNNKVLANSIMNEFKNRLNSNRSISTTDLYMYKNITTPGVLVECGYLSNYKERTLILNSTYQKKIAKLITNGVINYFEIIKQS